MKPKRLKAALVSLSMCVVLVSQSACGASDLDDMLLWADRVVGYIDSTRQVMMDIHCEECKVHPVSLDDTLDRIKQLQKGHEATGQFYAIIKANRSTDQKTVTLDSKAIIQLNSISPRLRDKVGAVRPGLPSDVSNRLAPTVALLDGAVSELTRRIDVIKPGKDGVVRITLTDGQVNEFNRQLARVEKIRGSFTNDLAALVGR